MDRAGWKGAPHLLSPRVFVCNILPPLLCLTHMQSFFRNWLQPHFLQDAFPVGTPQAELNVPAMCPRVLCTCLTVLTPMIVYLRVPVSVSHILQAVS